MAINQQRSLADNFCLTRMENRHGRSNKKTELSRSSPPSPSISLSLRFTRPASRSEITSVGISPSSTVAYAIYAGAQTDQPWIDTFDLTSQRGYSKIIGPVAAFSPTLHCSPLRVGKSSAASASPPSSAFPRIATLSNTLVIRDFSSGKTILELKEASAPIAWSPDGRAVAAAEPRHRIGMWDSRTGTRIGRVPGHIRTVTHIAFTPDSHLVTLSRDGTLRVTNPRTGKTLYKLEIESSSTNPRALAVSPDGKTVVSVWGTTVHIWMPQHGQLSSYSLSSTRSCEGWPLCISPNCRYIASWTEQGFDIMDVASGAVICSKDGGALVTSADFSTDGSVLALGRISGDVEIWDLVNKCA
ncbi:quinon protein alcohol dehydrogenase-like superfamily [Trichoderma ceciliae]